MIGALAVAGTAYGQDNTAYGQDALNHNLSGTDNTAIGFSALFYNFSGSTNTASGYNALFQNIVGSANTATGYQALYGNLPGQGDLGSGNNNTATGYQALYNNYGNNNTATGYDALYGNLTAGSGSNNTATGTNALYLNHGSSNTATGQGALHNNTSGNSNIALGFQAGSTVTTGSNNIEIGNPGVDTDGVGTDNGVIRIGTQMPTAMQKNTYIAGIYNVTSLTDGLGVFVDSTGHLGTASSSERFKTAIAPMGSNTAKLQRLRPVTFHYKADPQGTLRYGLIAEEVAQVYPELVVRDQNGRIDGVRYDELAPMLLNEMQQQQQTIAAQAKEISDLKQLQEQSATRAELKDLKQELQAALRGLKSKDQFVAQR
ncbi:MAG: tail fiber domain-containing protein [Steroidobacteraceae bacterium]